MNCGGAEEVGMASVQEGIDETFAELRSEKAGFRSGQKPIKRTARGLCGISINNGANG